MILLWGFRGKLLKPTYLGIRYCHRCRKLQHFYLFRQVQQFTLFFIPILWWTKAYFMGCGQCESAKQLGKEEYLELKEKYATFPTPNETREIYEFCVDMARGNENTRENIEKLFNQTKVRFDFKGFDEDFYKMIANIFAVQEVERREPHILD